MRKIKTSDVFKLARIIRLSGAKDELTETLRASSTGDAHEVGIDLMMTLISVCGEEQVEASLYDLIGGISEKKATEIKDMDFDKLVELLKEIADQNNLSNFFDTAVKSA